ncbi:MAG: beta-ketoacyl-[acyl-carrier-protein] synthase family protein [Deltaproteobacteria bacterium]|nr:beta-ketoacyl-[acyl-carrier-protein] synthase family protein [Deltaproteobacteria bacterium]
MRVVVTGIGVVSAIGTGRAAFEQALFAGVRGIRRVSLFDVDDQRGQLAAEVVDPLVVDGGDEHPLSRTDVMGVVAAREAVGDAALPEETLAHCALAVGGTVGGMLENEEYLARLHAAERGSIPPDEIRSWLLRHPLSSTANAIARLGGALGPRTTVCSACSSGANAIVIAARAVAEGRAGSALAVGTDALCRLTLSGFNALGVVDVEPCRPFDVGRRGLNLGEGAGALVLEPLEAAQKRGARIYAEVLGWSIGSEAHHITNPLETGEGAASVLRGALAHAGAEASHVAYVNAHGTGTPLNDAMEARALRDVLGTRVTQVPVSSSKGQIGHTLGAAGALEAIATILAIATSRVPPTAGLETPDPACALDHVIGSARSVEVPLAISSSFGFGGANTALVLGRVGVASGRASIPARRAVVVTGVGAATLAGDAGSTVAQMLASSPDTQVAAIAHDARVEVKARLDPARARRLDRLSRMGAAAVVEAFDAAGVSADERASSGVVLGTHLATLDDSAAFMHRVFTKGARLASPADFPNLVLSSPTGHATIYAAARGPSFTVSGMTSSGEAAWLAGMDVVASGECARAVVGGVGCRNLVVDAALDPMVAGWLAGDRGARAEPPVRGEGAAVLVLEASSEAKRRNANILASVAGTGVVAARPGRVVSVDDVARALRAAVGDATEVPLVVAPSLMAFTTDALDAAKIRAHRVIAGEPTCGWYEELGAVHLVAAVRAVAGGLDGALVVGASPGMAIAVWLRSSV